MLASIPFARFPLHRRWKNSPKRIPFQKMTNESPCWNTTKENIRKKFLSVYMTHLLWRSANARNVIFGNSLRWPIYVINSVDNTKLFKKDTYKIILHRVGKTLRRRVSSNKRPWLMYVFFTRQSKERNKNKSPPISLLVIVSIDRADWK